MKFSSQTYVRHLGMESLLWHKRNSACMILQDAEPFLRFITWQPEPEGKILDKLAGLFGVSADELRGDFEEFIAPLLENGLLETDGTPGAKEGSEAGTNRSFSPDGIIQSDSWTPLGSFFESHHIPSEFHIDLTSACTERCVHCYIPDYANRFLDYGLVCKALKEYKGMGGLTVHISGGECMMHPRFDDILRFCKKENINIIILSNLTLCNERKIELLKEIDPQFINVSLYSMDPAIHDSVTTLAGSWKRTMDAILKCESEGLHIRLAAPALKENRESFPALAEFAKQHHMHLVPDCDIFPQCDHDSSNLEHALSAVELKKLLGENKEIFRKEYPAENPRPEEKVCDIGKARICLDSQGNYYPCDGTHGLVLGNVREHTLPEVWTGEKMNGLRGLKNRDFPECAVCGNRRFCKVCPAHNFNATGNIHRHSPEKCAWAAVKQQIYGE